MKRVTRPNYKEQIVDRCKTSNLEVNEHEDKLEIKFPVGRDKRLVPIDEEDYGHLADIEFDTCKFLTNYEAVWCPKAGFIEAQVLSTGGQSTARQWVNAKDALGLDTSEDDESQFEDDTTRVEVTGHVDMGKSVKISIGRATDTFAVLDNLANLGGISGYLSRRITLRVDGLQLVHHDHVQQLLRTIADSFLFQFEHITGVAFYAAPSRWPHQSRKPNAPRQEVKELTFPVLAYDSEPMSLYWAGATSLMPLQRFFSYYQVIEYYYPAFSKREAIRTARKMLKDPLFSIHRDSDLGKLLGAVQAHAGGRGFGDERSQLRATISECVTASELRSFIESTSGMSEYYRKKDQFGVIAEQSLPLSTNDDTALLTAVADRIYQIRCRIVHTKASDPYDSEKALLPFSPETRHLTYDVALVRYLARQVLIASSGPLNL